MGGGSNPRENSRSSQSPRAMVRGHYRYPEVKTPLRRQKVHAPSRICRIGLSACTRQIRRYHSPRLVSGNANLPRNWNINVFDLPSPYKTDREVIDLDDDDDELVVVEVVSDDTSMEEVENMAMEVEEEEKRDEVEYEVVNLENEDLMVEEDDDYQVNRNNRPVRDVSSFEAYRKIIKSAENRTCKVKDQGFGSVLKERCLALVRSLCSLFKLDEEPVQDVQLEPFLPVTREEEAGVKRALSHNIPSVLVEHQNSNIDITGNDLSCLRPGEWLNDEVINLYLVLLKEREAREPKKFLKCHFFNTFFFTKLVNLRTGYNYGAVRRWTSVKKLGYHLMDCDKIFIPIHMNIHWTLAVINIKDRKLQYLDSFKGREPRILDALARYFVDEVRDKSEIDIDLSWWKQEFVQDVPVQKNGFDCGMFMLKYIDFYSRGLDLCFTQAEMPYFRVRTAKEILQLKAE